MAESRIKDENYYVIQGFMINLLGLKGVALNVYAIIYGFTQDGESEFTGSLQYLCEIINNVQFNRYKANLPLLKKFNGGSKETSTEAVKDFNGGSKETLPNNKYNNISIDNKDINNNSNISLEEEFEILWKMLFEMILYSKQLNAGYAIAFNWSNPHFAIVISKLLISSIMILFPSLIF